MGKLMKSYLALFLIVFCFQSARADWVKQDVKTLAWLHDVFFINENRGWIAGSGGTLLRTDDGGKTWSKTINFTEDTIRQVYFFDENNGWLLCERSVYNAVGNSPSYLLKTDDGGTSWKAINLTTGRERFSKILFTAKNTGLAIGESGAYFVLQEDGKTWKKRSAPVPFLLTNGIFTDNLHGTIVGAGGTILFTEDAGLTWNKAEFSGKAGAKLNSIFFVNKKNGWAVGTNGKIYQTINGGKLWYEQNSTVEKNLNDVFFKNTAEGWAIGDEGIMLHTTTAGNVWQFVNSRVKHKLEKLFFFGEKGWAVGFGGTILSYDAGNSNKQNSKQPQFREKN